MKQKGCPVRRTIEVLAGKWKVQIVWHLSFEPLRFAQLRRKLGRISEKVQTEQLRQLEADGVVQRDVWHSVPPAVTYSLTDDGRKLVPLMQQLCDWGSTHFNMEPSLPSPTVSASRVEAEA